MNSKNRESISGDLLSYIRESISGDLLSYIRERYQ
jgi:hypothetical protein